MSLAGLNGASASAFAAATGLLFEDAPWITRGLAASRPFASLTALHAAMMDRLHAANTGVKLAFLRGHPMLSPTTLRQGMTPESTLERRSMGMDALDEATAAQLDAANAAHLARFGFPFILAVRHASLPTILGAMERRPRAAVCRDRRNAEGSGGDQLDAPA